MPIFINDQQLRHLCKQKINSLIWTAVTDVIKEVIASISAVSTSFF